LTRAGLPLAQGLVALGEELPRGRLRQAMNELAHTLEAGVPLEQAVEDHKGRIPPHLRGLMIAGIRSRRLGDLLGRFSEHASIGIELKRAFWLSLAYPILMALLALAVFVFISLFVVAQFEAIFRGWNVLLPRITSAVFALARLVNPVGIPVVIAGLAGLVACLAARIFLPRPARRSLAGRLPLVGPVWRATALAEFCHLLALLLESDLPLPEAIRLTGEGVQDADLDASCRVVAAQVESGKSLSQAMAARPFFPLGLPRLLHWAEHQKSLPEVLHMAGAMFEARARSSASFVGTVLTFLCVILVLTMLLVVPALFAPLFTLISRLS
jgi:general secretion pathway protein F